MNADQGKGASLALDANEASIFFSNNDYFRFAITSIKFGDNPARLAIYDYTKGGYPFKIINGNVYLGVVGGSAHAMSIVDGNVGI